MTTIGNRIKLRREELGISQEDLGKYLGYKSRSSIAKIELDKRNLTQSKIKAIADALQTTPSYIMGWENDSVLPSNIEKIKEPWHLRILLNKGDIRNGFNKNGILG